MSQQINLFNPALRKTTDLLSAKPVAILAAVLLCLVGTAAAWTRVVANKHHAEAEAVAVQVKVNQDQLLALGKELAERKPSVQLANELLAMRDQLAGREEIMAALEGGAIGSTDGFAEYLRGFARQAPQGLWLTGFTIGAGGADMEIRGRMLSPDALPDYIRRLGSEAAFKGRSFAALQIRHDDPVAASAAAGTGSATPAIPPSYPEFTLMNRQEAATASPGVRQ